MVLVDTSVWIQHLRQGSPKLGGLLVDGQVVSHPFIVGEIACEQMKNRREILSLLQALPMVNVAEHDEALDLIERNAIMGKGLGYIDVHVLAGAMLSSSFIWTMDKKLQRVARHFSLSY
jgi:predicted nucleic acid-binding protein